jgi:hypothetical protein
MDKPGRRVTQRPQKWAAVRMPARDKDLWYAAACITGESQSAYLRRVLRQAAVQTISQARIGGEDGAAAREPNRRA